LYFDCSFVISEFVKTKKGVKVICVQNELQINQLCAYYVK
jgi:hypothetical protein